MNSKKYDGVNYPVRNITDLKDLFTSSISMFGDNAAYLIKDKKAGKYMPITYEQVGKDMLALGTKFVDMGLAGKKIGVIGETRYEWLVTYFTVVSGVGVIVPLDKNLPEGELFGLIERSGMSAIVYSPVEAKKIANLKEQETSIEYYISMEADPKQEENLNWHDLVDAGAELAAAGDTRYKNAEIDPESMSTLLFTSGTTGLAKGVMLSHKNLANNVLQLSQYFKIPEPGIVFSILPVHHVYAMTCDILTTFYQGKTIAVCEGLKYIQKNMTEVHPNVMLGVPLVFEKLYKGMWKQAKRRGEDEKLRRAVDLSKRLGLYRNKAAVRRMFKAIHQSFGGDLQVFVEGGAAADPFVIEEFEAMGINMVQGYGMSECSPIIALNRDRYRKAGPVGQPVQGAEVRIIDQDEDGIGQIIVKSPSVMMGYYENPEATAETIRDGWLYTGDLGYFDSEGFLYITGRSKTVIVTKGGKNIFPEEVEEILLKDELIQEVVVHGVEDERVGNVMITADIFPNYALLKETAGEMSKSDIYHFFRDRVDSINETMPPYKQVKRISIRETEFVKTTTGKIKRFGNKLSGSELSSGSMDYHDLKLLEQRHAKELVRAIEKSKDPYVLHRSQVPVTDVKDLLALCADKYGKQVAFEQKFGRDDEYLQITYKQAMADIDGLGTALLNRGFDGCGIAVIGDVSYQHQISFLAAMTGVGTSVPIDASLGAEEIARQLGVAGASVVIFEETLKDKMKELKLAVGDDIRAWICYDADDMASFTNAFREIEDEEGFIQWRALVEEGKEQISRGDRQFIDARVLAKDIAAIVFTAGQSGAAKGVRLDHGSIVANITAIASLVDLTPEDAVYSVIQAHSMTELGLGLLLPMYKGCRIVNFIDITSLERDFAGLAPTVLVAEPAKIESLYDRIAEALDNEGALHRFGFLRKMNRITKKAKINMLRGAEKVLSNKLGGKMRLVISAGNSIDGELLDFFDTLGVKTLQGYGMAECCALVAIDPDGDSTIDRTAVGHVLPNIEIRTARKDANGIGEILVKGVSVMAGYAGDDELTAKTIENGWFHTGDLGYVDQSGNVHITGRL